MWLRIIRATKWLPHSARASLELPDIPFDPEPYIPFGRGPQKAEEMTTRRFPPPWTVIKHAQRKTPRGGPKDQFKAHCRCTLPAGHRLLRAITHPAFLGGWVIYEIIPRSNSRKLSHSLRGRAGIRDSRDACRLSVCRLHPEDSVVSF
jgi:hypothetical protein